VGNGALVDWNWAGFQGYSNESLAERIDDLRAMGVRSLVLRDFGLDEYLARPETQGEGMPLAAAVLYLRDVLQRTETASHAGGRLRRLLDVVRRYGGDGVIVVNGDTRLAGRDTNSREKLADVIEAASPDKEDPPILFEPMAARLNDFFVTPDEALAFARERLRDVPVKLVFDTYHVAAAGPDDDRAFPGGGELPFGALLAKIGPGSGLALALEDSVWRLPPRESIVYLRRCVGDDEGGPRGSRSSKGPRRLLRRKP